MTNRPLVASRRLSALDRAPLSAVMACHDGPTVAFWDDGGLGGALAGASATFPPEPRDDQEGFGVDGGVEIEGCDRFPERVTCSTADLPVNALIRDWQVVSEVLEGLDLDERRYVTLSLPDNSYVQCFGDRLRLVVEVRRYDGEGDFTHCIVGVGELIGRETVVGAEDGAVFVDESQVLAMRDARQIVNRFLFRREIPIEYAVQDVSDRFK